MQSSKVWVVLSSSLSKAFRELELSSSYGVYTPYGEVTSLAESLLLSSGVFEKPDPRFTMHDILLIDDSCDDAALVKRALAKANVNNPVVHVADSAEALRYLAAIEEAFETGARPVPSVLLLDLKLPGMHGFEILERLQFRRAFQKTLRVALSGLDETQAIKKAYALGAQSFLSKPIEAEDLEELIKTYPEYWLLG